MNLRLSLFCFLALLGACREDAPTATPEQARLLDSIEILNIRVDSLAKTNISGGGEMDYWQQGDDNRRALKKKGINDPETFISERLSRRTDLIPDKPVLGGQMSFSRISLLGDRWAIAAYEDGHVGGQLLLRYSLRDTAIQWKVMDHFSWD